MQEGKGCEYRHSDGARVNPRDCWYWLNGNCLNLKCSFRHPPLDGLIGIPGASSLPTPPSQTVSASQILVRLSLTSHNPRKQSATCYFFQKGQCLKGDKCAFVRCPDSIEPELTGISVPHQVITVSAPTAETPKTIKKESWGLRPCARRKIPGATNEKLVGNLPLSGKSASRTECLPTNGLTLRSSYETANALVGTVVAVTMPTSRQSQPADEHFHNDSDADEFLRESTPGFHIHVDNDIGHFYYPLEEGEFLRESLQDGRTPNPDSEVAANLRRVMLKGEDDYRRFGREDRHCGREQQRTSSERYKDEQVMSGKRVRHRVECPDEIDMFDLRYRLLKQRRLHGPRSVVCPDGRGAPSWRDDRVQASCRKDHCLEAEKFCGHHSSKDQQHFAPKSSSTRLQGRIKIPARNSLSGHHSSKHQQHFVPKSPSTRLQGRIKIPARNSLDRPVDSQSERQQDRERRRGGLSLTRPSLNQEGHSDRLKLKLPDHFASDARSIGRHPVRRLDSDHFNFAGPKSLAELKGAKVLDTSQEQSNKSINSRLSLERTSPIPPNDVLISESTSPPENTELCSNGNEIDDALAKKGFVPEGVVKNLVQMECDVTNAAEDRETLEQNEESDEEYEDVFQRIEEEGRENLEQTEETDEVYEDNMHWTEDVDRETPNDLEAEEDVYEESAAEFNDDDDDFARKVALRFS